MTNIIRNQKVQRRNTSRKGNSTGKIMSPLISSSRVRRGKSVHVREPRRRGILQSQHIRRYNPLKRVYTASVGKLGMLFTGVAKYIPRRAVLIGSVLLVSTLLILL